MLKRIQTQETHTFEQREVLLNNTDHSIDAQKFESQNMQYEGPKRENILSVAKSIHIFYFNELLHKKFTASILNMIKARINYFWHSSFVNKSLSTPFQPIFKISSPLLCKMGEYQLWKI